MKKWNLVVGNKAKAKVLSVLLAVTMSFSLFGCGQTASDKSNEQASAAASEVEAEADAAAAEAKATPSHSSESGKDETVYIVTDASGNPTNITVNDQLKNKDGAATLVDKTEPMSIIREPPTKHFRSRSLCPISSTEKTSVRRTLPERAAM